MAGNSSGTLIGAILESVGYHYQGAVLDTLGAPLANEVGGLVYLVGVVLAIAAAATQGSYKMGVWLLIGPPLFFAVIQPREAMDNARWQFGLEERDTPKVNEQVENMASGGGRANVSKVFKRYVEMISAANREIVAKVVERRENSDKWHVVRGELYALMHTGQIENPKLLRLMHYSLLGNCREVIFAGRRIDDQLFRLTNNPARREIDAVEDAVEAKNYKSAERTDAQDRFEKLYTTPSFTLDQDSREFVALLLNPNASAEEVKNVANSYVDKNVTCEQIWTWTYTALEQLANVKLQEILREGERLGISKDRMAHLMKEAHAVATSGEEIVYDHDNGNGSLSAADIDNLVRIIAKYYLRNEFQRRDKSSWLSHFVTRLDSAHLATRFQGTSGYTTYARVAASEWSEKERIIMSAGSLPYYQGLLLYFLGVSFPFFALLLLIPGKQAGFLLWFLLWLWVKSWDIGFAVVTLLEDLIFAMLATQNQTIGKTEATAANEEIAFAFATLNEMDPTFQLATYYMLVGTATLAIPMTSAQIILGGAKAGVGIVSDGVSKMSDFFADAVGTNVEQQVIHMLHNEARELKMARAEQFRQNLNAARPIAEGVEGPGGKPVNIRGNQPTQNSNVLTAGNGTGPIPGPLAAQRSELNAGASAAGSAEGWRTADKPFRSVTPPVAQAFFGAIKSHDANVVGTHVSESLKVMRQERIALGAHANWLTDIDQASELIYERIAIFRGIPIPWSNMTTESSGEEFKLAMQRFAYEQEMMRANLAVTRELWGSFVAIAAETLGSFGHKGVQASKLTPAKIAALPEAERVEIYKRFNEHLSKQNTTLDMATRVFASPAAFGMAAYHAGVGTPEAQLTDEELGQIDFGGGRKAAGMLPGVEEGWRANLTKKID